LDFQEWLVRDGATPSPDDIIYVGIEHAEPTAEVLEAVATAELLVFAPSSPAASLGPMVGMPRLDAALRHRRKATIAISPLCSQEVSCERDARRMRARQRLMAAVGLEHDVITAAAWLRRWASTFVLDPADEPAALAVRRLGFRVTIAPTVGEDRAKRAELWATLSIG
jgi:LPPG:FO 2-phospho-L-lactate transferase